jgi:hypothetical protein
MNMQIRLHIDYETDPIWVSDATGLENIDPGQLPIPGALVEQIRAWAVRYLATYNRDDPASSGFSSIEEKCDFDQEGRRLWSALREELGPNWVVSYFSVLTGWEKIDP